MATTYLAIPPSHFTASNAVTGPSSVINIILYLPSAFRGIAPSTTRVNSPLFSRAALYRKAVDIIKGGEKPGTVYRLNLNDLKETTVNDLHGCSLFDVIKMAQSITEFPGKVDIYGIEPEIIKLNTILSKLVKKVMLEIKKIIKR